MPKQKKIQTIFGTGESLTTEMSPPDVLVGTVIENAPGNGVSSNPGDSPQDGVDTGTEPPQMEEVRKKPRNTINKRIHIFRGAISNSQSDSEFIAAMAPRGYTMETLNAAMDLVVQTINALKAQVSKKSRQHELTRDCDRKVDLAWEDYEFLSSAGKLAFREQPEQLEEYGLSGPRESNLAGKLAQMDIFYDILQDTDEVTEICKYNVTIEALEAGRLLLLDAIAADYAKKKAITVAKAATAEKNVLYARLKEWMKTFYGIARMVLKDSPHLLDSLSMVVPYLNR
ncbi:MAG: hypothetical protein GY765_27405 [bacterium]|nr:hypothetical protein [bacterium]